MLRQMYVKQRTSGRSIEINSTGTLNEPDLQKIVGHLQELSQDSETQQITINLRELDPANTQDSMPSTRDVVSLSSEVTEEERLFAVREAFSRGLHSVSRRNPFLYHACIIPSPDAEHPQTATVKVDTGSKQNWVSLASLQSWGLFDQAVALDPESFQYKWQGFFGEPPSQPSFVVELCWYMVSIGKTRKTLFLVNESSDALDLLIGWEFLVQEGPAAIWNEPVSAIREIRLTPGSCAATARS